MNFKEYISHLKRKAYMIDKIDHNKIGGKKIENFSLSSQLDIKDIPGMKIKQLPKRIIKKAKEEAKRCYRKVKND